ncbi:MAG: 4Fe-4S dicluster domain-containing protein [Clostridia bacterium]|nr:4Fe-4S dicluster domain-containing protein [Clostridia bacterium]
MRKCSLSNSTALFNKIAENATLYIPVDLEKGRVAYKKYADGMKMSDALKTDRSAKDFFFPQTENLMEFKTEGKSIEIIDNRSEAEDFVVFGVRACDVKSLEVLDKVFLAEPVDSYYKNRREHGVIVSMACTRPTETCFCGTFGIDASAPKGDIECYKTDDAFYFNAVTEKGEALLAKLDGVTESSDEKAVNEQKEQIKKVLDKLPLKDLKADEFGADKTDKFFNSPEWKNLSEACLGCGTCTFVCPTCQCYDIKDFKTNKGVQRFRCWDSCMYSDFTKMSAGQPRLTQMERFRQRFMHKLVYFPTNNDGMFSCVGCGRCVAKCPISMNLVKVMKTLGGQNND